MKQQIQVHFYKLYLHEVVITILWLQLSLIVSVHKDIPHHLYKCISMVVHILSSLPASLRNEILQSSLHCKWFTAYTKLVTYAPMHHTCIALALYKHCKYTVLTPYMHLTSTALISAVWGICNILKSVLLFLKMMLYALMFYKICLYISNILKTLSYALIPIIFT